MSEHTERPDGSEEPDRDDRTDPTARTDRAHSGREPGPGLGERAARTTGKNLHVHPDEATGDVDPFDEDGTEQTPHGLKQNGDDTTR